MEKLKTILNLFKDENEFHHEYILNMYDNWYDEAVIDASERAMKRQTPNWRLTNH